MTRNDFSTRNCIFCGSRPSSASNEHFIARWLSIFAGNDEIPAEIADADGNIVKRRWSSLKIPACSKCNGRYGEFERLSKPAFERASRGVIRASDVQLLLDYFDKLRISIWLWRLYWCKKQHSISPNFHVDERVALSDRVLLVAKYPEDAVAGIAPIGYETRAYLRCPTVLGIFIKNLFFLSVSSAAFLTDHFGATGRVEDPRILPKGMVGRRFTGGGGYITLRRLFRMQGQVFFSFGNSSFEPGNRNMHIFFDSGNDARRIRVCEEFNLPRMYHSRVSAKPLAQLNVHELQLNAIREFYHMNVPGKELLTTEVCEEDLRARIRGDHLMLQACSPLIRPNPFILDH